MAKGRTLHHSVISGLCSCSLKNCTLKTHAPISKQTFVKYYCSSLLLFLPTFSLEEVTETERQMANLRTAVWFFWSPESAWNVIWLQIMSHMLLFHLIIPGTLWGGFLPKQCLSALENTYLTDHTHLPQHRVKTFSLSFCNMVSRRIRIFLGSREQLNQVFFSLWGVYTTRKEMYYFISIIFPLIGINFQGGKTPQ